MALAPRERRAGTHGTRVMHGERKDTLGFHGIHDTATFKRGRANENNFKKLSLPTWTLPHKSSNWNRIVFFCILFWG